MNGSWPYCSLWQATQIAACNCYPEEANMSYDLTSVKVAVLVADGFERDNVLASQEWLHRAGASVTIVSAGGGRPSESSKAGGPLGDVSLTNADETGFDALLVPGEPASVDKLSRNQTAIDFVRAFIEGSKPVGAIDQGVRLLLATNAIAGRRVSADPASRERVQKMRGVAIEKNVATDRNLVTASDIQSIEPFYEAFARSCFEHKSSTGASLHTD
jgi:protease I